MTNTCAATGVESGLTHTGRGLYHSGDPPVVKWELLMYNTELPDWKSLRHG